MAPSQVTDDYYQILDIPPSAGRDAIRASYRKLALKYHPDRNRHNPQATAQFQLLQAAYSTLHDPERRQIYDGQYATMNMRHSTNPNTKKYNQYCNTSQHYKIRLEQVEAALEDLRKRKGKLENDLFDAKRECNKIQAILDKLQEDADRDAQEELKRNSWFGYFFARQPEAEKQERQRRVIDNRAARTVREAELKRHSGRVTAAHLSLDTINKHILNRMDEKRVLQQEAVQMAAAERQEAARKAEVERREAVRRAEVERREAVRIANIGRQQAMQEEREAKARTEAERRQKDELAERVRKEQEAEGMRKKQEAKRMPRKQEARNVVEELLQKHREEMQNEDSNAKRDAKADPGGSERKDSSYASDARLRHPVMRFAAQAVASLRALDAVTFSRDENNM